MTRTIHNTVIEVETFPVEFNPVLKLIKRAIRNDTVMEGITSSEAAHITLWLDTFESLALEHGV